MAWIYLAESAGSRSHLVHGLDQSPTVKLTDMLSRCCCRELVMGHYLEVQSGMTLHRLEAPCYQVQSTSSREDSHARTSALLELERAWEASEADFSSTSQGLSVKQTRDLYFSKTSQQLELVASTMSRKHLPSSGMIVDGRLYQPPKLAPRTLEKGGSCLPTPCAKEGGYNKGGGSGRVGKIRPSLSTMARAHLWPTPRASEAGREPSGTKDRGSKTTLCEKIGGQLNPTWVEWLMGYPLGWTELEDWAMQWFRSRREKRSKN